MKNLIYNTRILMLFSILFFALFSCKKDDFNEEETYIKVYGELDGNMKFVPLAIQQTADGGSLILSAVNGWNIFLMRTDALGEVVWKTAVEQPYVSATPNLFAINGSYYFVCMDEVGLFTYLMEIDFASGSTSVVNTANSIIYPTYAYYDGANLFIQNYNRLSNESGIHRISSDFQSIEQSSYFDVMTSVLNEMVNHVTYAGRRFPFFIQSNPERTHLIMSCFYNYSFSLVMMDQNLDMTGVYNGAAYAGGVNGALSLEGSRFAIAKFSNENQYFNPIANLDFNTIGITADISANGYSDLDNSKPIVIKDLPVDGKSTVCMVATTKSNQLLMQLFDKSSGSLIGTKYLGNNAPLTVGDLTPTSDGGAMLLVQIKVMGATSRLATIKLSKEQLDEVIGKVE